MNGTSSLKELVASISDVTQRGYGFVSSSVYREFNIKYRASLLGFLWAVLNPLAMVLIYTIVFTHLMKARLPGISSEFGYGIYLCAGILCWSCFSEVVSRCQNIFLENANLIKKLAFPRLCLPVVVMVSAVIGFTILFLLVLFVSLLSGGGVGLNVVYVIPLLAILLTLAGSVGLIVGVLNVFVRDVGQMMGVILQFWFWLTPIVYPVSILPESVKVFVNVNPLTKLVESCQNIFLYNQAPIWHELSWTITVTIVLLCISLWLYRKSATDMVDSL